MKRGEQYGGIETFNGLGPARPRRERVALWCAAIVLFPAILAAAGYGLITMGAGS